LSRLHDRPLLRLAVTGALVALGLAACGRKGPLDPPPSASLVGEQQTANAPVNPLVSPLGNQPKSASPSEQAAKGPKKHIFLDDLLN